MLADVHEEAVRRRVDLHETAEDHRGRLFDRLPGVDTGDRFEKIPRLEIFLRLAHGLAVLTGRMIALSRSGFSELKFFHRAAAGDTGRRFTINVKLVIVPKRFAPLVVDQ